MKEIEAKYIGPIVVITGRFKETIRTEGKTIGDVVKDLSAKYEGFSEFFLNQEIPGMTDFKGMIILRRNGQASMGTMDLTLEIRNADTLTFW
jgi:molybdopterin converting factor small subunit